MKKEIFKACLILAVAAVGTNAYAAATIDSTGTSLGSQSFKPSNNVQVFVNSVAGSSTAPGGYAATSAHASGDRQFATNSTEPKIFWEQKNTSTPQVVPAVDTSGNMTSPSAGWSGWNSL